MADIFTFGEAMALFMSSDTDSVKTAIKYEMSVAGAEGNVGVAATRLGLDVYFQTKLGKDFLGDNVISHFQREGVETKHFIRTENFTGAMVRNRGMSEPLDVTYLRQCSAASTFVPEDIDSVELMKSRWLHVTGITVALSDSSRRTVAYALDVARANNIGISFDLNIRPKLWSGEKAVKILLELAHDIDLLTGGVDEYELVFGGGDPDENFRIAARKGIKTLVMTAGPELVRILHNGERFDFAPQVVKTVDPVGSGDAFIAGTICGLLAGLDISEAIEQGSKCGAAVAATMGDWGGMLNGSNGILSSDI
jgi:2-dehydro-3-deoxygluconokinase